MNTMRFPFGTKPKASVSRRKKPTLTPQLEPTPTQSTLGESQEQALIQQFISDRGVTRLSAGHANAYPIEKIRAALQSGRTVTIKTRKGRAITFTGFIGAKTTVHDEDGGRSRRRRKPVATRNNRQR